MHHWLERARTLRKVRQSCREFLLLWATQPQPVKSTQLADEEASDTALADPDNHNWKLLYRGSVLDD